MTPEKIDTIKKILSVFETGKAEGSYGTCTVLKDGAGISYGRHQATDKSGTVDLIVKRYIELHGELADELAPFVQYFEQSLSVNEDPNNLSEKAKYLISLLKMAGNDDPLMAQAQEEIFDSYYMKPARLVFDECKCQHPLTLAVLYDTSVHSGPARITDMRKLFAAVPPSKGGDEKTWTTQYCKARRAWLLQRPNPIVQKTVYRMDAFLTLIEKGNWDLVTPLTVRSVTIK